MNKQLMAFVAEDDSLCFVPSRAGLKDTFSFCAFTVGRSSEKTFRYEMVACRMTATLHGGLSVSATIST